MCRLRHKPPVNLHALGRQGGFHGPLLLGLAAAITIIAGCQTSRPAAAVQAMTREDEPWKPLLSEGEQHRTINAMASAKPAEVPQVTPSTGPSRGRWSDVPDGVRLAAASVEMAVVTKQLREDVWEFALLTIEDKPATLRVQRTNDDRVWQASAAVGLFNDDINRRDALLDAFEKKMHELSRKRKFE